MSVSSTLAQEAISAPLSYHDEERYEIVDGKRVEMSPMSFFANQLAFQLGRKLADFADEAELGCVTTDNLFRLPAPINRSRRPDVAFVSSQRWPKSRPLPRTANALEVVPDLAVEVVSPNDLAEELQEKVAEYFQAGVRLVWVIYPLLNQVIAFESLRNMRGLLWKDELNGADVLPGFRLPLSRLFPEESATPPPTA